MVELTRANLHVIDSEYKQTGCDVARGSMALDARNLDVKGSYVEHAAGHWEISLLLKIALCSSKVDKLAMSSSKSLLRGNSARKCCEGLKMSYQQKKRSLIIRSHAELKPLE